jgi:TPR repeat protein
MANGANTQANLDAGWEQADRAANAGDIAGVLFLLRSLVDKGVWAACARIGEIYERGGKGVPRDMEQAIRWYREAVFEADDPVAHLGLGRAYLYGDGVDLVCKSSRASEESAPCESRGSCGLPRNHAHRRVFSSC